MAALVTNARGCAELTICSLPSASPGAHIIVSRRVESPFGKSETLTLLLSISVDIFPVEEPWNIAPVIDPEVVVKVNDAPLVATISAVPADI
jgi:hypothetical protein